MKKAIITIAVILAFFAGCRASFRPIGFVTERIFIEDVTGETPGYFPVLVTKEEHNGGFSIGNLTDASLSRPFVSILSPQTLERINKDLESEMANNCDISYASFWIRDQSEDYVDVALQVIAPHGKRHAILLRTWYRIQDGRIIPQKQLFFGPGFAFVSFILVLLVGALSSLIVWIGINKIWPQAVSEEGRSAKQETSQGRPE